MWVIISCSCVMLAAITPSGKKQKGKKCDTERYRTEAQRPQWLAMPFHLVLCWSSCHWIFERSKKSLKVTWKVAHEKQQEAKSYLPVQVTLSLNSWPLTSSEGAQWGTGISGGDFCCSWVDEYVAVHIHMSSIMIRSLFHLFTTP